MHRFESHHILQNNNYDHENIKWVKWLKKEGNEKKKVTCSIFLLIKNEFFNKLTFVNKKN